MKIKDQSLKDIEKLFELMKTYEIEQYKDGDILVTRQSLDLDKADKLHEKDLKKLVNGMNK